MSSKTLNRGVLAALAMTAAAARAWAADPALEARVDAYVAPYARSNNFSGAILIARDGRVLVRKAWGYANLELGAPNTPETRFHLASVSKPFTAAAILLLEDRGKLRVEDPLSKWIPGYPNGDRLTLHHLLAHTSGIPNVNGLPVYDKKSRFPQKLEDVVSWFRDKPLEFEPGSRYRYSNSNYNLLALVIEKASGEPYGFFLKQSLFDPLGMQDTAHDGDAAALVPRRAAGYVPAGLRGIENAPFLDWSVKTGNGSLYSTVDDLFKWDRALREGRVLSAASRRKMFNEHLEGVGYGWFIRQGKRPSVAMSGRSPGFAASIERFLDDDLVVILAGNLYSSLTQSMAPDLAAIALGEERSPLVPETAVTVPHAVLARYVGRYQLGPDFGFNPNMVAEVRREPEGLALVGSNGGGTTYLIPLAEDRFLDRSYGGTLRFVRGPAGEVRELVWNFGRDYAARRIPGS